MHPICDLSWELVLLNPFCEKSEMHPAAKTKNIKKIAEREFFIS